MQSSVPEFSTAFEVKRDGSTLFPQKTLNIFFSKQISTGEPEKKIKIVLKV
jgi:hypothetical protein